MLDRAACVGLIAALVSCGPQPASTLPAPALESPSHFHTPETSAGPSARIGHIVIIIQENRTPDNLFQGLAGADIANSGLNSKGQRVKLAPVPLEAHYDVSHAHESFITEYDGGKMDGFDLVHSTHACRPKATCAYGYVPRSETKPYFDLAAQYVFADRMFQTNQGPSFPAHQYLISGTSTTRAKGRLRAADNPFIAGRREHSGGGGCDAPSDDLVKTIDPYGDVGSPVFPCFDRPTLGDLLDDKKVSWRYYEMRLGPGLWHPFDAIRHIRYGRDYANVVTPSSRILSDIARGRLAHVSWVTPSGDDSDHAGSHGSGGPAWVASIVNAMGHSAYWKDCAIFVLWDDWGGWYDHVAPPVRNSYELGFRVPLLVVSPYAQRGHVSHAQYEFGTILKFVEDTFRTGSMNTTDAEANRFDGVFDFTKGPRRFSTIAAPRMGVESDAPDSD
ncbi:MAG: alkaline phosphatase family protein [Candidatus Tumulicola sp.]